jgi:hypothetical protein
MKIRQQISDEIGYTDDVFDEFDTPHDVLDLLRKDPERKITVANDNSVIIYSVVR